MRLVKTSPEKQNKGQVATCGLCGKKKKLTHTSCCNNLICDDEENYVVFSYARNSCHRNHRRFTLCGYHESEGHKGKWQDCSKCRNSFEPEICAWYGTNEYNFEKLQDPPSFTPKHCNSCHKQISLSQDGYSMKGREYYCDTCTSKNLRGKDRN